MSGQADMLWWFGCLIASAVGTAMLVYAVRQKDAYALIFGLLISALPMFVGSGVLMTVALTATIGLFVALRKYL
jgi:predicted cobalt transporter CbtA